MTNTEFKASINSTIADFTKNYGHTKVVVNYTFSSVSIEGKPNKNDVTDYTGKEIFFQGEDTQQIIDECEVTSEVTGLPIEKCILWYLESAGTLQ